MTPSDLVALIARLRETATAFVSEYSLKGCPEPIEHFCEWEAAAAIEQLQAELDIANMALKLKPRPYADADLLIEERDAARAELAAVKADAERYRWLTSEPEGARHLLSLLQREGSKSIRHLVVDVPK